MRRSDFLKGAVAAVAGTSASGPREAAHDQDPVDVRSYGALGDGVQDDSGAIQRAIDAVGRDGGTVWIPAGTYRCNASIRTSNVRVVGEGIQATVIVPASNEPAIRLDAREGDVERCEISDLSIVNLARFPGADGIRLEGMRLNDNHLMRRLFIRHCRRGIDAPGRSIWLHLQDVEVKQSLEHGISFTGEAPKNVILMEFVRSVANGGSGLYARADFAHAWTSWCFVNCNFELNESVGVHLAGQVGFSGVSFDCCYFEDNSRKVAARSASPPKASICVDAPMILGMGVRESLFFGPNPGADDPEFGIHVSSRTGEVSVDGCRFEPVTVAAVRSTVRILSGQNRVGGQGVAYDVAPTAGHSRLDMFLTGMGEPSHALGADGDLFVRRDGDPGAVLYIKRGGKWSAVA